VPLAVATRRATTSPAATGRAATRRATTSPAATGRAATGRAATGRAATSRAAKGSAGTAAPARCAAVTLAVLGLFAGAPAAAQEPTGGTSPTVDAAPAPAAPAAPEPTANLYGSAAPRVGRFVCRRSCGAGGVRGRHLKAVGEVLFLGAPGEADDASVAPRAARRRSLLARVPLSAVSGPIALALADGTLSAGSRRPLTVEPRPVQPPAGVIDAEVQRQKVFFGEQREAELSYVVGGSEPASVRVDLIRAADGAAIEQWAPGEVQPGVPQTIRWDGTAGGKLQRDGVYRFQVSATSGSGRLAASSDVGPVVPEPRGEFTFLRYRFPLIGAHDYGEGAARFGGGRGHQGQDVFAECGTPIVAARGGVVQFKRFQSAAGNYVVIDGARTGVDFGYMHLREAAIVDEGDRVKTGQLIGYVGATGRASGCHLHFEEWTAPGWYSGGSAFDPMPDLRAWDAES
jgi:murein DD-endopeptidase MepM/ murein hydrolase activator NlpD